MSESVRLHPAISLIILGFLASTTVIAVSGQTTQMSSCQQQFIKQMASIGQNNSGYQYYNFIDPDTPDSACQIQLCQGNYTQCQPGSSTMQLSPLYLVFSDEFNVQGRKFGVENGDPRWTAQDMYYFPTQDVEVYKPEQVQTWDGKAIITIDRAFPPISAKSLQPDGTVWDVDKNFKSGMVTSWNKWCFTGGYMEMSVQLPGSDKIPGFWPAFWAMGNLGRAGYMPSTSGFWPYSYDVCGEGSSQATSVPGSKVPSQILPQCINTNFTDPNWVNRTAYGMKPGVARNAPEFDVFEVIVTPGKGSSASQTLQMAPLLPPGQSWADLAWYDQHGVPDGVNYPGSLSFLNTNFNGWSGIYGRPGNEYQDSMSAVSLLNSTFYNSQHTFGVDWAPGEYMRWYVDGIFAYEINPYSLMARNGTYPNGTSYIIGERILPVEPMYILWNLGMSEDFGTVDIQNLPFPSYMMIDYIRVYQRPNKMNVGCSPPDMPTEQWINCHKNYYTTSSKDDVLFGPCNGAVDLLFSRIFGINLVVIVAFIASLSTFVL